MASNSVKIFYRYDGIFERNPSNGSMLYKDGILRSTLFPHNGNYEQLKTHLVKLTRYNIIDMKIMYAVDDSSGARIFVDVQEDDDVACMLFEITKVDLFISTQPLEQSRLTIQTLATDQVHSAPNQITQPPLVLTCSSDAPSSSLRPSNKNDMATVVSDVDPGMDYESEDGIDSPHRKDEDQGPICKGQFFDDVQECRKYLVDYAIRHKFVMRFVKSDHVRVTAKCSKEGCTWRVHCSNIGGTQFFRVKTVIDQHTCSAHMESNHKLHASSEWVGAKIKGHLQGQPKLRPKDIIKDIQREHGVTLSYRQAWCGKEAAMRSLHGSFEESFHELPKYLFKLRMTNPDTGTYIQTDNSHHFERLFIAFSQCLQGFIRGCRPLIGLNDTILKGKYIGIILTAVGIDANGAIFPIAFAIVEKEDSHSWSWFLTILKERLDKLDINNELTQLTIISDREKGLYDLIKGIFPNCHQAYCMHHLVANMKKPWKFELLRDLFWNAARALTVPEFEDAMSRLHAVDQTAHEWLANIPADFWATAYFSGKRYGHLTSNIAESFNSWIENECDKPIIFVIDRIRVMLMSRFHEKATSASNWTDFLVPSAQAKLDKQKEKSRYLTNVMPVNEMHYEIHADRVYNVDLQLETCTCNLWQASGIPCSHAIAAMNYKHLDPSTFCSKYFRVEYFKIAYASRFEPMPDNFAIAIPSEEDIRVLPPKTRRSTGRPRNRLIETDRVDKVQYKCKRCGGGGHNKRSCKVPL